MPRKRVKLKIIWRFRWKSGTDRYVSDVEYCCHFEKWSSQSKQECPWKSNRSADIIDYRRNGFSVVSKRDSFGFILLTAQIVYFSIISWIDIIILTDRGFSRTALPRRELWTRSSIYICRLAGTMTLCPLKSKQANHGISWRQSQLKKVGFGMLSIIPTRLDACM